MKTVTALLILILTLVNISSFELDTCETKTIPSTNFANNSINFEQSAHSFFAKFEDHTNINLIGHQDESTQENETDSHSCHLGHCSFVLPLAFVFITISNLDSFNLHSYSYPSADLITKRKPPKV